MKPSTDTSALGLFRHPIRGLHQGQRPCAPRKQGRSHGLHPTGTKSLQSRPLHWGGHPHMCPVTPSRVPPRSSMRAPCPHGRDESKPVGGRGICLWMRKAVIAVTLGSGATRSAGGPADHGADRCSCPSGAANGAKDGAPSRSAAGSAERPAGDVARRRVVIGRRWRVVARRWIVVILGQLNESRTT